NDDDVGGRVHRDGEAASDQVRLDDGDEPARLDVDSYPAERLPVVAVGEYPRLEVQAAFPVADLGVVEVEHLSVDRQSQKGRIGHVDDRLARGGETIGRLGIDDRPCLVEAVDEGAALVDGSPLVERPPDPEATVAEGQHGLEQGGQLSRVGRLDDRPAVDGIEIVGKFGCDLDLLHGTNSARSSTTTSAPALERASPTPCRATPITAPKPPATPASTPATASSITRSEERRVGQETTPREAR